MANVNIVVNGPLMDGHKLTFKAPCDCTVVDKLNVLYVKDNAQVSKLFTMVDSHGNDLTGLGNLFAEGAYVRAILDTKNGRAYLQNAATNAYLEKRIPVIRTGTSEPDNSVGVNGDIYIRIIG